MPSRNLVIVHTAHYQDLSDWTEVKRRIDEWAPDIDVRILNNNAFDPVIDEWHVTKPLLVFSPNWLKNWQPRRGVVYAGARVSKFEQAERLARLGLPVPPTYKLTRDFDLNGTIPGDYVVVKPQYGYGGHDTYLVKRQDLRSRYDQLTENDGREMVIQPYLEHSEAGCPTEYRVLTLFGQALYCARNSWRTPRQDLQTIASDPNGVIASNASFFGRVRDVCNDRNIIKLGESACPVFLEHPVLAVDILRDINNGKHYILEVNPVGPWHLSSDFSKKTFTPEHRRDLYAQFDALDRIARLLIDKTRAEAN